MRGIAPVTGRIAASVLDAAYLLLLIAAAPWLVWRAIRTGRYREGWAEKFWGLRPLRASSAQCIWWHAVSVGEVNLLALLLAEWGRRNPDWDVRISTTTHTGYALARKKYPEHSVFYCPLDFSWAVRRAMHRLRPKVLVLAELELWPNLIAAARLGRCSRGGSQWPAERSQLARLSPHPLAAGPTLRKIDLVAAQDRQYCRAIHRIGRARGTCGCHRLSKVRRLPDRSTESSHAGACQTGRYRRRRTWCCWLAARRIPRSRWPWNRFAISRLNIRICD